MAKVQQLIEDSSLGCDFSEEEVLFYAQQIGIDVLNEKNLLWIAKEGLSANVPSPWLIFSDEAGRIFYYNPETHEASWNHPLDKDYASLVSEERTKSLNSVSSDYGFESKLSSLADAPPLSSSGKNTPTLGRLGKSDGNFSGQKIEFGRIQNRRSTQQLAPVRLNNKMPTTSKTGGGLSFMPKGSTLAKNIRRTKEVEYSHQSEHPIEDRLGIEAIQDESNESLNSDEGSKYSYEDSEEEDNDGHEFEPEELRDTSQLSPMHSATGSPNALEISSLVLNARLPIKKVDKKENSPSLSLRKAGQPPSFLKPMTQAVKKKGSFKGSQNLDPLNDSFKEHKNKSHKMEANNKEKFDSENDAAIKEKVAIINKEQKSMLNEVQNEWLRMQDEIEKQEKEKYEKMQKESSKILEEQERKIRNENSEALLRIQNELSTKVLEEEKAAEKKISEMKEANKKKTEEEQRRLEKELESINDSLKDEIRKMEEKKSQELAQKQRELDESFTAEIKNLQQSHEEKKKSMEEALLSEITKLQDSHKLQLDNINQSTNKENSPNTNIEENQSLYKESEEKYQALLKSIEDEKRNHKKLLNEKENILKEISAEKNNLKKLKTEISEAQLSSTELQEEMDRTENDLDLLRSEKSALISELNIIKENIKNEKNNLLNLEKKFLSEPSEKYNIEFAQIGVNTESHTIDTACKSSQASVSSKETFCQVENMLFVLENSSQTLSHSIENKSCQTEHFDYVKEKAEQKVVKEIAETSKSSDDTVKMSSVSNSTLDSRLSVIEQHLRFLQEKLLKPSQSSQEPAKYQFIDTPISDANDMNIPPITFNENQVPLNVTNDRPISTSSHIKCRCELGDAASCNIMQDVKNSIFQMNDILNQHFVEPFRNQNVYRIDYSSPFENFYAQARELQEKQRLAEMKRRCESEFVKLTSNSSSKNSGHFSTRNFTERKFGNPPYNSVESNLYSYNDHENPIHRARNLVLKEQAKAWKDQQSLNALVPHILSSNITSASPHTIVGVSTPFNNMSSYQPFLHFEIDPETDYNNWMTKLNALQHRLRSHKM